MLIDKENITTAIPQRAPFVMIDELMKAGETGFETQFEIQSSNLFLENGILSESALIENVAQTCAAGFGYLNAQAGNDEGQLGFIGSVSKLTVANHANIGDKLNTKVEILTSFDAIHLIEGAVFRNSEELIRCQMKIVIA